MAQLGPGFFLLFKPPESSEPVEPPTIVESTGGSACSQLGPGFFLLFKNPRTCKGSGAAKQGNLRQAYLRKLMKDDQDLLELILTGIIK